MLVPEVVVYHAHTPFEEKERNDPMSLRDPYQKSLETPVSAFGLTSSICDIDIKLWRPRPVILNLRGRHRIEELLAVFLSRSF